MTQLNPYQQAAVRYMLTDLPETFAVPKASTERRTLLDYARSKEVPEEDTQLSPKAFNAWLRTGQMSKEYWEAMDNPTHLDNEVIHPERHLSSVSYSKEIKDSLNTPKPTRPAIGVTLSPRAAIVLNLNVLKDDIRGMHLSPEQFQRYVEKHMPYLLDNLRSLLVVGELKSSLITTTPTKRKRMIDWNEADYLIEQGYPVAYDKQLDALSVGVGSLSLHL